MSLSHGVYDGDNHFVINPATRVITNQNPDKVVIIQNDHNSERFTFEIPLIVDGHDMSKCTKVQIHYINIANNNDERNADVYEATDLQIDPENPEKVICSWLISNNATKLVGTLNFIVRYVCEIGDKIEYAWNTAIFSGIKVGQGIDNAETVIMDYSDVLETWHAELQNKFNEIDQQVTEYLEGGALKNLIEELLEEGRVTTIITEQYTAADTALETKITKAYGDADTALETKITKAYGDADNALQGKIDTKANQSDLTALASKVNAFLDANAVKNETIDTLVEIQDYIASDAEAAAQLVQTVGQKANQSDLTALETTVNSKANQSDLTALEGLVASKVDQSDYDGMIASIEEFLESMQLRILEELDKKADQIDLTALETKVTSDVIYTHSFTIRRTILATPDSENAAKIFVNFVSRKPLSPHVITWSVADFINEFKKHVSSGAQIICTGFWNTSYGYHKTSEDDLALSINMTLPIYMRHDKEYVYIHCINNDTESGKYGTMTSYRMDQICVNDNYYEWSVYATSSVSEYQDSTSISTYDGSVTVEDV